MTTEELADHLHMRARFHIGQRDYYDDATAAAHREYMRMPQLADGTQRPNPASYLRQCADTHRARHAFVEMLRTHLVQDETYELSADDLARLEYGATYTTTYGLAFGTTYGLASVIAPA